MMMNHFGDNEAQELFGKHRIKASFECQSPKTGDLAVFTSSIGGRQASLHFVQAHGLSDLEPLGQQVDQGGIDVVDAGAI